MRGVGWLLVGTLAGIAVVVLLFGSRATFHRSMDFNSAGQEDFRGFYHPTAAEVLETGRPTPGFLYPPSFALALTPLGRLDRDVATRVWIGIQLGALLALMLVTVWILRPTPPLAGLSAFLTLTAVPIAHSLHWGQVSLLLGVLILGAVAAGRRGRGAVEGLALAGAAAIKLYPIVFLLPFGLCRGWRAAGMTLAACMLLAFAVPALVLGFWDALGFWDEVFTELRARRPGAFAADNAQALAPTLGRWFGLGAPLATTLAGLAALAHAPLLWRVRQDAVLGYGVTIALLPLIVEPHWPHYFVLLPFVQTLALVRGGGDRLVQGAVVLSVLCACLPTFRAFALPADYGASGLLLVANVAALAALWRVGYSMTRTS